MKSFGPKAAIGQALCALVVLLSFATAEMKPAMAQTDFDDKKLAAFIDTAIVVNKLIDDWIDRINGAASKEHADRLAEQANSEVIAAIERAPGITLDEYTRINKATQDDPDLVARMERIFRQKYGN
jgi:hypothetical protein